MEEFKITEEDIKSFEEKVKQISSNKKRQNYINFFELIADKYLDQQIELDANNFYLKRFCVRSENKDRCRQYRKTLNIRLSEFKEIGIEKNTLKKMSIFLNQYFKNIFTKDILESDYNSLEMQEVFSSFDFLQSEILDPIDLDRTKKVDEIIAEKEDCMNGLFLYDINESFIKELKSKIPKPTEIKSEYNNGVSSLELKNGKSFPADLK